MDNLLTIDQFNFSNRRALVRVDFNVPLGEDGEVTSDARICAAVPTLQKILDDGGSCVVMSHLGRPRGVYDERYSIRHILNTVKKYIKSPIKFSPECVGPEAENLAFSLKPGEVLLLENLRFHPEEQQGNLVFAKALSRLGDIYVNDAFGVAHRTDASVAQTPQFFQDKCLGRTMETELSHAFRLTENPRRPFLAVIGGGKIADKIGMIDHLLDQVDDLIVGGGMAYTFIKAMGGQIGRSLVEEDKQEVALKLMEKARKRGVNLHLPVDAVAASSLAESKGKVIEDVYHIDADLMGLDIGPKTSDAFAAVIARAATILWNGPMGVFERLPFSEGTRRVGEAIAQATRMGAYTLVGGGDSAAATHQLGMADQFTHVSTGGGALLAYVEGKPLPAIAALRHG